MFQMTQAPTHPVKAHGIIAVLTKLKLLDMVQAKPDKAALIFVVPERTSGSFQRQEMEVAQGNDDDTVDKIKGIGGKRTTQLAEHCGIRTIGELRAGLHDPTKGWAEAQGITRDMLFGLLQAHDGAKEAAWVKNIPQYVWGTDGNALEKY